MSLYHRILQLSAIALLLSIFMGCSHFQARPDPFEKEILESSLKVLGPEYSQPRLLTGKLVVNIDDIQILTGENLSNHNQASGIPAEQAPSLRIWSSDIREFSTQKLLSEGRISPEPSGVYSESEYENQIIYWDLSSDLVPGTAYSLSREFSMLTFDYRARVDRSAEHFMWSSIPDSIINKYTRSELFLEQDAALIDTVFALLENIADPVSQAEAIYHWVQSAMIYIYPPEKRGVRNALATRAGDCGQYSALFITAARIAGIPARQQSGFNFYPGNTGAHVWSEIFLPIHGWVPVDATRKDGFLHLDNGRLITSIGLNIIIPEAPAWATFENSEVENGKTDFMQMFTLVSSGIVANYSSTRQIIRSVGLK